MKQLSMEEWGVILDDADEEKWRKAREFGYCYVTLPGYAPIVVIAESNDDLLLLIGG